MPSGAWYLLIAAGCIVLVFAIWKGRGIKIRRNSITVDPVRTTAPTGGISVASGAEIRNSITGDITGVSVAEGGAAVKQPVDVLRNAKVVDSRTGAVTGVKQDKADPGRP